MDEVQRRLFLFMTEWLLIMLLKFDIYINNVNLMGSQM